MERPPRAYWANRFGRSVKITDMDEGEGFEYLDEGYEWYRSYFPIEHRLSPTKIELADSLVEAGVFPPEKATALKEAFALADQKEFRRRQAEGRELHELIYSLPWYQRGRARRLSAEGIRRRFPKAKADAED